MAESSSRQPAAKRGEQAHRASATCAALVLLASLALTGCGGTGHSRNGEQGHNIPIGDDGHPLPPGVAASIQTALRHADTASAPPLSPAAGLALALRSFHVFRRPARASDSVPWWVRRGKGPVQVGRLVYSGHWGRWYLYVEGGQLCSVWAFPHVMGTSGGCGDVAGSSNPQDAINGFTYLMSNARHVVSVRGILPDSVRSVTFTTRHGNATVHVHENTVVYTAPDVLAWKFVTPDGHVEQSG